MIYPYTQYMQPLLTQLHGSLPESFSDFFRDCVAFSAPFDYEQKPMAPYVIWLMFLADLWVWYKTYYCERRVAKDAHKKYHAHGRSTVYVVAVHAISGVLETVLGLISLLYLYDAAAGEDAVLHDSTAAARKYVQYAGTVALVLHIPTGLYLSPKVWGLRHITVTGYVVVNLLRLNQCLCVFGVGMLNVTGSCGTRGTIGDGIDVYSFPNLWLLLHMATCVRLIAYYFSPWTSYNGSRSGDLLTDPIVYTLTVTVAALITLGYIYPPFINLLAIFVLSVVHVAFPSKVGRSIDRILDLDNGGIATGTKGRSSGSSSGSGSGVNAADQKVVSSDRASSSSRSKKRSKSRSRQS